MIQEFESSPADGEPVDERFVRRVVAALVHDRHRRRMRLFAAAALLFFFFAGAGQTMFTAVTSPPEETYAGLVAPSALEGLLAE